MKMMNKIRLERLIKKAISRFDLNLTSLVVLTEAASGYYMATPIIAALANAEKVFCICKDSIYGKKEMIKNETYQWAKELGVENRIEIFFEKTPDIFSLADIITNLGHVRPITAEWISFMKPTAVIPLMWETWEYRKEDIDLEACRKKGILVLGTNEMVAGLEIFEYLGLLVMKLLFELDVEVFQSKLLLISSGVFGDFILKRLTLNRANVLHIKNIDNIAIDVSYFKDLDAIILAEHRNPDLLIGKKGKLPIDLIKEMNIPIVHICGNVIFDEFKKENLLWVPSKIAPFGHMSVTTAYLGPKPVIDLNTAGLKVGEAMARGRRLYNDIEMAKKYALANSPAMDF